MIRIPVLIDPVIVTEVVVSVVTIDAERPLLVITVGVLANAVGKVYVAVPSAAER